MVKLICSVGLSTNVKARIFILTKYVKPYLNAFAVTNLRVIVLDNKSRPPIIRFLCVVGIPVIRHDAVFMIYLNHYEKHPTLIEACQHLNISTCDLLLIARLEAESCFCNAIAKITESEIEYAQVFLVHLSRKCTAYLCDKNYRLYVSDELIGTNLLSLGQADYMLVTDILETLVASLFSQGLRSTIVAAAYRKTPVTTFLDLSEDEIDALWGLFATAPMSLHVGALNLTVWERSACHASIILKSKIHCEVMRNDLLATASPMLTLSLMVGDLDSSSIKHLDRMLLYQPGLLCLGAYIKAAEIAMLIDDSTPSAVIMAGDTFDLADANL